MLQSTCPAGLKVCRHVAGPAAATDCITSYRRSLLTMSLAAAAVLIVRGVPTEHRPSKTSTATTVAVEAIHRGGDVGGDDRNNTSFVLVVVTCS